MTCGDDVRVSFVSFSSQSRDVRFCTIGRQKDAVGGGGGWEEDGASSFSNLRKQSVYANYRNDEMITYLRMNYIHENAKDWLCTLDLLSCPRQRHVLSVLPANEAKPASTESFQSISQSLANKSEQRHSCHGQRKQTKETSFKRHQPSLIPIKSSPTTENLLTISSRYHPNATSHYHSGLNQLTTHRCPS